MSIGQWIGVLALVISLYILWQIRGVLLLVFAAVVLATALNVLVQKLHRSGMKRSIAILTSISTLVAFLVVAFLLIVPPFSTQFQELAQLLPKALQRSDAWIDQVRGTLPPVVNNSIPDLDSLAQQLQPLAQQLFQRSVDFFSTTFGVLLNLLLVLILTLMLLADPGSYRQAFIRVFPSFYRRRVDEILDLCGVALRGWLIGILFNMTVIGTLSGLGLLILGIRLPLAQAVLAGLLTFIPNIGPTLSVIPPVAIALLDAPWKSIAVVILYVVIQQLETNLLTPLVMAQQVSLLPAVTLLSQVFFATFFGFLGLLLALPLTVVGQVWLQEVVIKDVLDPWNHPNKRYDRGLPEPDGTLATDKRIMEQRNAQSHAPEVEDDPGHPVADETLPNQSTSEPARPET